MFEPGSVVAEHITPVSEAQVQPNGVDLTAAAIYEQTDPGRIGTDGKTVGDRREIEADEGVFALAPGAYVLQYAETVHIPDSHVGFIYPRSTLMRNWCMRITAGWESGEEGRGEGLLEVHRPIRSGRGARVAQCVLAAASHDAVDDGSYQGERTG